MARPRFGLWAPVYGNHGARNHPADAPDAGYRRNRDLLVRAEQAGFDSTLLAQHVIHPSNVEDDVLETWDEIDTCDPRDFTRRVHHGDAFLGADEDGAVGKEMH